MFLPPAFLCVLLAAHLAFPVGASGSVRADELTGLLMGEGKPYAPVVSGFGNPYEIGVATELVRMGPTALPSIRSALDRMEERGPRLGFETAAGWLLYAFAKLERERAFPRLQKMLENPRMMSSWNGVERAVAISLGLTSYRSTLRGASVTSHIGERDAQDVFDQFVLAWVLGDQAAFEATLSPRARAGMGDLLRPESWRRARSALVPATDERVPGFGYRLHVATGIHSLDPLSPLAAAGQRFDYAPRDGVDEGELEFYKDAAMCALPRVRFVVLRKGRVAIDNPDIAGLLRSISPCLSRPAAPQGRR